MSTTQAMTNLIDQVSLIYKESGIEDVNFDATKWTRHWVNQNCPALNNHKPIEYLKTTEGINQVKQVLACMQSGAYL